MPHAETERGRGAGEKCRLASKQRRLWGQPGRAEISRRREGPGQLEEVSSTGAKQEPRPVRHGDPVRGSGESTRDTGRSREGRGGAAGCRKRSRQ